MKRGGLNGEAMLARARDIVGPPPPGQFRNDLANWQDRLGAVLVALVERARGYRRDPRAVYDEERRRQDYLARIEAPMYPNALGEDRDDAD